MTWQVIEADCVEAPDNKTLDEGADGEVYGEYERRSAVGHATDGLETVEDWRCVGGCPVAELDKQSAA